MPRDSAQPLIRLEGVSKRFGGITAVSDVSLDIMTGEMFALLGGSGCGKTTLLRMLAGFETPSEGRIFIDGKDMAKIPPYDRPVNMMFQSYALFPHMTVAANIGYGLKYAAIGKAERVERVRAMLDMVQLTGLEERKPHQLSGGQRQRVALARALALQPRLLLLDEPLAALDRKLRERTQFEIMSIQERTGITFVVVTHDQEEAMTLADRIAVMDKGRIRQVGSPEEVYEHPRSRFVADFIGAINMFEGEVTAGSACITVPALGGEVTVEQAFAMEGGKVMVAVRPEKISLSRERPAGVNSFSGVVKDHGYFGKDSLFRVALASGALVAVNSVNTARAAPKRDAAWGGVVWLSFEPAAVIVLRDECR